MTEIATLDRAYEYVMSHFVRTGRAPHYTELAQALKLPVEEGFHTVRILNEGSVKVRQLKSYLAPNQLMVIEDPLLLPARAPRKQGLRFPVRLND